MTVNSTLNKSEPQSSSSVTHAIPHDVVFHDRDWIKKIAIIVFKPLFLAIGAFIYAVIRLLEPWRRIRIGTLWQRIGHQALETETLLRLRMVDSDAKNEFFIFISPPPANKQLIKMFKRRLWVLEWIGARAIYNHGLEYFISNTRFGIPRFFPNTTHFRLGMVAPQLNFLPDEEERGRKLLADMGVGVNDTFVCIHSRDKAYLDAVHLYNSREIWSYHDYRDCDIENYMRAAEQLASLGIYVIRLGSVVEKELDTNNPRIIDYASRYRSDFFTDLDSLEK